MANNANVSALLSEADLSTLDRALYMEIWHERVHTCYCCGAPLLEPRLFMFHHILEKRVKAFAAHADYSRFRHCKWNIMLLCWACHTTQDTNPASKTIAAAMEHRDWLIEVLEDGDYTYDREHIYVGNEPVDTTLIQSLFPKKQQIRFTDEDSL